MDMNDAIEQAREEQEDAAMKELRQESESFQKKLRKKKLLAKTTRYFKSSLIAWSKNLSLQNLSGR